MLMQDLANWVSGRLCGYTPVEHSFRCKIRFRNRRTVDEIIPAAINLQRPHNLLSAPICLTHNFYFDLCGFSIGFGSQGIAKLAARY